MSVFSPVIISKGVLACIYLNLLDLLFPVSQDHYTPQSQNWFCKFMLELMWYHSFFNSRIRASVVFCVRSVRYRDMIINGMFL